MSLKKVWIPFILVLVLLATFGCSNSKSSVKDFPNKPIQLIVSFSPGAATDTQARIIAKYAKQYLGKELVIVNKPGGGGSVGWNYFSSVPPDGYILAAYNLPHIITQPLVGQATFKVDTFDPIINWGQDPTVFAVTKDSPIQDLDDLIQKAKKSPGELTVGTAGKFVGQHMAVLQLEKAASIDLKDIPYKGSSDSIASLLGKHTDLISGNLSDMYRLGDQIRILAIATKERHPLVPNVPTFTELGYPDVVMSTDRGIAAKKGTPKEIIDKLEKSFMQLMNDPKFLNDMKKSGSDMLILNREQVKKEFENRKVLYEQLIKSVNINE
ncbi:tripartite tricarboxylate transporter substrate binding protein [Tepidibacillus fermentans]|uniref:Tripartite-type tricarboxylate transporter receptor subunit TctC n=1 Tax=Tepidibacillus fermentans TaxID=1281767 RepID=A0A4R3KIC8_9BACI|nr:tripartite tricarboxylate transporter substrate binding protein [Tepidibacillus fermentans]TCS83196.1 tripartite-type tricarboxylate transporter receptor subunit TctC [Tepidibacillus fermentans]